MKTLKVVFFLLPLFTGLKVFADLDSCGTHVPSPALRIDPATNGLHEVLVYLERVERGKSAATAYPLRMGLHAAAVPFLFMLAFALMSYRSLRLAQGRLRAIGAALAGAFLVPCITSYTQPEWMGQGLGAFGLFMGAQYAVWQAALRERSA